MIQGIQLNLVDRDKTIVAPSLEHFLRSCGLQEPLHLPPAKVLEKLLAFVCSSANRAEASKKRPNKEQLSWLGIIGCIEEVTREIRATRSASDKTPSELDYLDFLARRLKDAIVS